MTQYHIGDKVRFYCSLPHLKKQEGFYEGYLEYVRASEYDAPGIIEIIDENGIKHKFWPPYEAVMTMEKL